MASHGRVVLHYHDTLLRQSDFDLLDGPCWLNDKLIALWFDYLENERYSEHKDKIAFIAPEVVQFLKFGSPEDAKVMFTERRLPDKRLVVMALNNCSSLDSPGGTHWSLLIYTPEKGFQHYDSSTGNGNISHGKKTARVLTLLLRDNVPLKEPRVVEVPCIQQENGYDCGLHVICNADAVCQKVFGNSALQVGEIASLNEIRGMRRRLKDLVLALKDKSMTS